LSCSVRIRAALSLFFFPYFDAEAWRTVWINYRSDCSEIRAFQPVRCASLVGFSKVDFFPPGNIGLVFWASQIFSAPRSSHVEDPHRSFYLCSDSPYIQKILIFLCASLVRRYRCTLHASASSARLFSRILLGLAKGSTHDCNSENRVSVIEAFFRLCNPVRRMLFLAGFDLWASGVSNKVSRGCVAQNRRKFSLEY